ncbi:hypothetical protein F5B22DRAFT_134403 [Xylaria bambusicola]|uniref:uncharacterized protein n=1 Tax=Xylaria bambusicola TaxID=326684 RepID=UPI002007DD4C|nr:uncharacterized protein F5B22DRAFT_134403 [Xylaria bambusicola]KAI0517218.1 hypothetical protein F5B22DRAFT_134403 [Xylaria bambusicola]
MCDDDDDAKEHCKIFLQWYVQTSGRYEACLGPEEYQWAREVGSAVTVLELWKNLVVEADLTILWKKRQEARKNRRHWMLAFVGGDKTGPVAEVSRFIAGPLTNECGLTRKQTFIKREITSEDIALLIRTLWFRAPAIPLTSSMRVAFHSYLLVVGLGGFRNASVLNMLYEQVQFGLVRDQEDPTSVKLVVHILVHHNKRNRRRHMAHIFWSCLIRLGSRVSGEDTMDRWTVTLRQSKARADDRHLKAFEFYRKTRMADGGRGDFAPTPSCNGKDGLVGAVVVRST